MKRERLFSIASRGFDFFLLVTLFTAPTQWAYKAASGFHLSLADVTLALAGAFWLATLLLKREGDVPEGGRVPFLPPWPFLFFAGWCGVAALAASAHGGDVRLIAKELVQIVEYFCVGGLLFNAFLRGWRASAGLAALLLGATVNIVIAVVQYRSEELLDSAVRGTFTNDAVYGGLLCLVLPFGLAGAIRARFVAVRLACVLFVALGLFTTLDGASHWALLLAATVMAVSTVVVRRHRSGDEFAAVPEKRGNGVWFFVLFATALALWQGAAIPHLSRVNDSSHFASLALYNDGGKVNKRYAEWQAAYNMGVTHPLAGVGLGCYQTFIGQYYDAVPREPGPSVPDTQNLYLVLFATAGFPAILAFLACLALPFTRRERGTDKEDALSFSPASKRTLRLACAGAAGAFAFACVWHPLLQRGIGLPLVFVLTLASRLAPEEEENA
ncbi:MAG: O-antigen ligase family protein [Kiritimatiellae bacterium]|nr:O-antigen ligase family protein [Kiritimatiellia bacterium]